MTSIETPKLSTQVCSNQSASDLEPKPSKAPTPIEIESNVQFHHDNLLMSKLRSPMTAKNQNARKSKLDRGNFMPLGKKYNKR